MFTSTSCSCDCLQVELIHIQVQYKDVAGRSTEIEQYSTPHSITQRSINAPSQELQQILEARAPPKNNADPVNPPRALSVWSICMHLYVMLCVLTSRVYVSTHRSLNVNMDDRYIDCFWRCSRIANWLIINSYYSKREYRVN